MPAEEKAALPQVSLVLLLFLLLQSLIGRS